MIENAKEAGGRKNRPRKNDVKPGKEDQATTAEFEREGMGVAPKE